MLPCEVCQQNAATVHLTEIEPPDKKTESHLCESCAQQKGIIKKPVTVSLASLLGASDPKVREVKKLLSHKCPECGISWPEFRAKGRLGCPKDYELFRKGLMPLLEKIHGAVEHCGKTPARMGASAELRKDLNDLRAELARVIKREEYEKAAEIRDRIHELEKAIEGAQDGPQ